MSGSNHLVCSCFERKILFYKYPEKFQKYVKSGICLLSGLFFILSATFSLSKPIVIPSLKEWTSASGQLTLTEKSKIVYNSDYAEELAEICSTLREDIKAAKNWDLNIVSSKAPGQGDIYLTINNKIELGDEGYYFTVDDKFTIEAPYKRGIFWGTRTLLQLLKQSESLECGKATDYPDYPERGLMVDLGRRYCSIQWLKNHIRDLSYLKMNLFHLHLSDNEGFRLECETYPQITSTQHYTKKEIRELEELAGKYFVEIIPEIDMPNHMSCIMRYFPELWLVDSSGNSAGECCLDFTLPESRKFTANILNEYLPLFKGKYWHLGCDEFITDFDLYPQFGKWAKQNIAPDAKPFEAYFGFINWEDSIVKSYGKTTRVWNDWSNKQNGAIFKTKVNKDIIIEYWNGDYTAQRFIDEGYNTINCSMWHLYYNLASSYVNNELIYNNFEMLLFNNNEKVVDNSKRVIGAKFHIWNDWSPVQRETEYQTANTIKIVLRILAEKTWSNNNTELSYNEFRDIALILGRAPQYAEPESPTPNNLAYKKKITASSIESGSEEYDPVNANDGDISTRWSSKYTDSEWIYIDFGEPVKFTSVKLDWEYSYATHYSIMISNDALSWTEIYENKSSDGFLDMIDGLNAEARYLKIDCRKRFNFNGYSLWEIEVYDSNKIINNYNEHLNLKSIIYPNPAVDYINIADPLLNGKEATIYTISGILVSRSIIQYGKVFIGNLSKGAYALRIENSNYLFIKTE